MPRIGNEFDVVTAFLEKSLRVSLLKIFGADLGARDVCGDREHRNAAPLTIKESVEEIQVSRSATTRSDCKVSRERCIGTGCKSRDLLVTHGHPLDIAVCSQ